VPAIEFDLTIFLPNEIIDKFNHAVLFFDWLPANSAMLKTKIVGPVTKIVSVTKPVLPFTDHYRPVVGKLNHKISPTFYKSSNGFSILSNWRRKGEAGKTDFGYDKMRAAGVSVKRNVLRFSCNSALNLQIASTMLRSQKIIHASPPGSVADSLSFPAFDGKRQAHRNALNGAGVTICPAYRLLTPKCSG
jgi:hypothetical protein